MCTFLVVQLCGHTEAPTGAVVGGRALSQHVASSQLRTLLSFTSQRSFVSSRVLLGKWTMVCVRTCAHAEQWCGA